MPAQDHARRRILEFVSDRLASVAGTKGLVEIQGEGHMESFHDCHIDVDYENEDRDVDREVAGRLSRVLRLELVVTARDRDRIGLGRRLDQLALDVEDLLAGADGYGCHDIDGAEVEFAYAETRAPEQDEEAESQTGRLLLGIDAHYRTDPADPSRLID